MWGGPLCPRLPQKIGKYEVRGLVGKGAMGVVYNAVDPALGRAVAIKTLSLSALAGSPHEAELKLRFLREARSAGMLQHPNIITVHELFEEGGTAYLVMELLEGASLSSLLRRKKELTLGERLSILNQIAAGLSEAHAHRIIHRDLKPSNVFVLKNGVAKVLDFGVAKMGEGELTKAGTVFGTLEYMAPEQVRGIRRERPGGHLLSRSRRLRSALGAKPFSRGEPRGCGLQDSFGQSGAARRLRGNSRGHRRHRVSRPRQSGDGALRVPHRAPDRASASRR